MKKLFILIPLLSPAAYANNQNIESFEYAKKALLEQVYTDYKQTFYCGATFAANKKITHYPNGFTTTKYKNRVAAIEFEHVVPAENFGRFFYEWRDGHPSCVTQKGKSYKGRDCATKANRDYRLMQADLYNLWPAIGSVNALRSNHNFTMLPGSKSSFGACEMKIDERKAEPPIRARGPIARSYLYMEQAYPIYKMSGSQRKLMLAWDASHPVTQWECERGKRIETIQKNINGILKTRCNY